MEQAQSPTSSSDSTEALAMELTKLRALLTTQQATITQQQAAIAALEQRTPLAQALSAAAADAADGAPDEAPSVMADDAASHATRPRRGSGRGTSRRGLLRGAAAGAAAVAVAAVAVGGTEQAHAAPLATGGNFLLGDSNSADATTFLSNTTAGGAGLEVTATGGGVGIYALTDTGYGLSGVASGNGTGVIGVGEGTGPGVEGKGDSGVGGYFHGALAPLLLGLGGVVGAPTSGAHSAGEIYMDSAATLWVCVSSGTPGAWNRNFLLGQVNTIADATTYLTSSTPNAGALQVTATGQGIAIYGLTDTGYGLYGSSGSSGAGVYGVNSGNGSAVVGHGSHIGVGGTFTGGLAPLALGLGSAVGAPTANTHSAGEIYLDSAATMWVCVAGGTPGTWAQVATTPSGATGGAITYLSEPIRLLDTRVGQTDAHQTPGVACQPGAAFTVTVAGVSFTNPTTKTLVNVPSAAVGAIGNVTVVTPSTAGFVSLVPSGAGFTGASNVNYTPGVIVPNCFNVPLNGGNFDIFVDPASAAVNVLIDLFAVVV